MPDFRFINIPNTTKWVISAPKRANRPNIDEKKVPVCPFCIGNEHNHEELYRVGGKKKDTNWRILVVKNKFPIAPIHEIIIHSPDHHKNFEELPVSQIELVLQIFRQRYNHYSPNGIINITHNRGIGGGESLPHPHSQLVVLDRKITTDILPLDISIYHRPFFSPKKDRDDLISSRFFYIFCPEYSQWPDEVWIAPMRKNTYFGDIYDHEISDLAFCLKRLIEIFDIRHGHEFPFNFYIYPGKNWYLRIIPRQKILGFFELATGVMVNTQDPSKTLEFIKEHFSKPDLYKIRISQQADYWKSV